VERLIILKAYKSATSNAIVGTNQDSADFTWSLLECYQFIGKEHLKSYPGDSSLLSFSRPVDSVMSQWKTMQRKLNKWSSLMKNVLW
jgi:hypothetical protein